ncbi:MAG: cold shock domain-containing protein [Candidatus Omnitrophica bacterium]|nr:cold shock domain-containing protein [Candidatus Omnitrophota bacterium]
MPRGTVKWFDNKKGYGFIAPQDGTKDVFVHYSAIGGDGFKTLAQGDEVDFEVSSGPKGDQATKVVRVGAGSGGERPSGGSGRDR